MAKHNQLIEFENLSKKYEKQTELLEKLQKELELVQSNALQKLQLEAVSLTNEITALKKAMHDLENLNAANDERLHRQIT